MLAPPSSQKSRNRVVSALGDGGASPKARGDGVDASAVETVAATTRQCNAAGRGPPSAGNLGVGAAAPRLYGASM